MSSNQSFKRYYFGHSIRILFRYQQIYLYPILVIAFILMPKLFSINEKYIMFLFSFNFIIVLWLYSPFYLGQFSFSSDDARSLTLFPLNFKDLVMVRNILNFSMLIIAFILSIILIGIFYPVADISLSGLMFISAMHLLPAISIGNLTSRSAVSWMAKFPMSWKSIFVILIASFNDFVIKVSLLVFSQMVMSIVFITLFLMYLLFYILSFRKIVREITFHFSSIAEK